MRLRTRAAVTIRRPRAEVYDFAVANQTLARTLQKYGPIPGIERAEMTSSGGLTAGAERRVSMSDGSVIEEEILEADRPRVHRYRWVRGLRPPFSLIVRTGEACWTFSDAEGGGTDVEWLYIFQLRSLFAVPAAAPVLLLFRRWMQRGLDRIRADLSPRAV
ncbi:MAG TPA: SRPBCC family protein [Kofleriaceae bacterium]|nr:SRPBCC family protein [Kofleriaceae bacterium]